AMARPIYLQQRTCLRVDNRCRLIQTTVVRGRSDVTTHRRGGLLVSTAEIKQEGLITRAVDWVFGYDFFISYNHGDGSKLPLRLRDHLAHAGFRVFLDQTEYVAGLDLRRAT